MFQKRDCRMKFQYGREVAAAYPVSQTQNEFQFIAVRIIIGNALVLREYLYVFKYAYVPGVSTYAIICNHSSHPAYAHIRYVCIHVLRYTYVLYCNNHENSKNTTTTHM